MYKRLNIAAFAALVLLAGSVGAGCDFQAAEDAFNDFDLVIGLQPVNTVFSLTIVDAGTGNAIPNVDVEFSGDDVASLIDVYSDALPSSQTVDAGALSFGVNNAVVPSETNPVQVRVSVAAGGYFSTSRLLSATATGTNSFTVRMTTADAGQAIAGTQTASTNSQNDSSGASTTAVIVQTAAATTPPASQPTQAAQAQATVSVAAGTIARDSAGMKLVGDVKTDIRVYDTAAGLSALPAKVRTSNDGTNQITAGATFMKMVDSAERVAVSFTPAGGKSATCAFQLTMTLVDPTIVTFAEQLNGSDYIVRAHTLADDNSVTLSFPAPPDPTAPSIVTRPGVDVTITVCLDGVTGIGLGTDGIFFSVSVNESVLQYGQLAANLTISNSNALTVGATLTVIGGGFNATANVEVPSGGATRPLRQWLGDYGSYAVLGAAAGASVTLEMDDGSTTNGSVDHVLAGAGTVDVGSPALAQFSISAVATCDSGEFTVRPDENSLDGLTINYRRDAPGTSWMSLGKVAITVSPTEISASKTLSLKPDTDYVIWAVFDTKEGQTTERTPAAGGDWSVDLDAGDYGFCG